MFEELHRIFEQMEYNKLDILLISAPHNITYISGYDLTLPVGAANTLTAGPTISIIARESDSECATYLITSNLEKASAQKQNRLDALVTYTSFNVQEYIDPIKDYLEKIGSVLRAHSSNKSSKVGIELKNLPVFIKDYMEKEFPAFQFSDSSELLNSVRMTKTAREISIIREVVKLNDIGQNALFDNAKEDIFEIDIYDKAINAMEKYCGHKPLNIAPFSVEFITGPRTSVVSYPGGPINKKTKKGDMAIFDLSLSFLGYWADTTNTMVIGANPTNNQLKYFNIAKKVIEAAFEIIKPGIRACDVEAHCRKVYESYNIFGPCYIGHQIGATVNERPSIVCHNETIIKKDMVFSLEPGAYEGEGGTAGARLEKMILVTDSGIEILSQFKWGI
ncbi:MAG: Xaa-Pro peptidase family protein [Actinomycetota bacterium]